MNPKPKIFFFVVLSLFLAASAFAQNVDSLKRLLKTPISPESKVNIYNQLASYSSRNDSSEALKYSDLALELASEIDYQSGIAQSYLIRGTIFYQHGNYNESNKYFRRAIESYQMAKDNLGLSNAYVQLSNGLEKIGHLSESMSFIEKALEIGEEIKDEKIIAQTSVALGKIYNRLENFEKALEMFNKHKITMKNRGDLAGYAVALNNLGDVYKNRGEFTLALEVLHEALQINKRISNNFQLIYNYATLGEVHQKLKKLDSAFFYAESSLDVSLKLEDPYEIAYGYCDMGRVLNGMKQYDKALNYLKKAYTLSTSIQASEVIELTVNNLHTVYLNLGKYDSAYFYLNEYFQRKQEIWYIESKKITSIIEYYDQQRTQIEQKQFEEREKNRKTRVTLIWIIAVVIIVGLAVLSILQYRKYIQKLQSEETLTVKNKEIEAQNFEIAKQKEKIEQSLINLQLLSDIGKKIISSLDIETIVETVYENVTELFKSDGFGIGVFNETNQSIDFVAFIEKGEKLPFSRDFLHEDSKLSVWCFKHRSEIFINDFSVEHEKYISKIIQPEVGEQTESIIYIPLVTSEKAIGVITVQDLEKNAFTPNHLNLIKNIALYTAIAIENAEAYQKIIQNQASIQEKNEQIEKANRELLSQKQEVEEAYNHVKLLSRLGGEITSSLDLINIIETVHANINLLLDAELFSIGIYNPKTNQIDMPRTIERGRALPFHSYDLENENRLAVACYLKAQDILIKDLSVEYNKYTPNVKEPPKAMVGEIPSSVIYLPLFNKGTVIGVITVQSFKKNAYNEYDVDVLRSLATYAAIALQNAESYQKLSQSNAEVERSYKNVKLLGDIGQAITSKLSVTDIINTVYSTINSLMDASVFWIGIYQEQENSLLFEGGVEKGSTMPNFQISLSDPGRLAAWCFNHQKEVIINDYENEISDFVQVTTLTVVGELPGSLIYVPLTTQNRKLGVLTVQSFDKGAYSDYHLDLVRNLAVYTEIALENALLYQNLEQQVKVRTQQVVQQKDEIEKQKEQIEVAFENVKLLSEIGMKITQSLSIEKIIETVYENVNQLMDAVAFGIGIYQPEQNRLEFKGAMELGKPLPIFYHYQGDETRYSIWCLNNQKEVFLNDAFTEYFRYVKRRAAPVAGEDPESIIYLPLVSKDVSIGVITVQSLRKNAYTQYHIDILRNLAIYITIAVENAKTYRHIEEQSIQLAKINNKVTASINYAKRIQRSILPQRSAMIKVFDDSLALLKPRDIVSGDFFWFSQKGNIAYIAVADCTGHGVPGAIMSMIGSVLLNECVNVMDLNQPDEILNVLHASVRKALKQDSSDNRDGMDIAICAYNPSTRVIHYAGAHIPLVYILEDGTLHTIKGDKMAIGGIQQEEKRQFTLHHIQLPPQKATVYLITDGFQDQFGHNVSNQQIQKFMTRRLYEVLLSIHAEPMIEQYRILEETFNEWKGDEAQTDDVLVVGFRV
jgi:transcriptional regulator with GAF, ATPase, and Fis domain